MASILNADNGAVSGSAGLKSTADSSGVLALQTNGTTAVSISTDQSVSIPKGVGGTPAFSAYLAANQSITTTVWTKITINTEEFDTASCFDNATNYRFTPTVAGYYQVNGSHVTATASTQANISIYKNGVSFKAQQAIGTYAGAFVSAVIYFNGTTDYIELWGLLVGTTPSFSGGVANTYFQAAMVRGA
jgi:hypothetical protein